MNKMKALTYTIIAGSRACPNDCPICISKMTSDYGIGLEKQVVNWKKFDEATKIALSYQAKNVLITGKGEPTLFPDQVTQYLVKLYGKDFRFRELQTEGSRLVKPVFGDILDIWKELGLDTIAVSIYHYDPEKNKQMFRPRSKEYFDLRKLIDRIHDKGMNTRLSCVLLKGYIDNTEEVRKLIEFAKANSVSQLTLRRADRPEKTLDEQVAKFVDDNRIADQRFQQIGEFIEKYGHFCYSLPYGAGVYELEGQNVCITTGLTPSKKDDLEVRQLIFFPQGWLTTSWEKVQGGRLL